MILGVVFLAFLATCAYLDWLPVFVLVYCLSLSTITLGLYGWDKFAARRSLRRIREKTLHTLGLLGGWPGAAIARPWFRHKTVKVAFRRTFWLTVAVNLMLVGGLFTPYGQGWLARWVPFLEAYLSELSRLGS